MNKLICALILWGMTGLALAAGGHGPALLEANVNIGNKTSLQRGARLFVNYCLSCHSAQFMRYQRMATDLGLDDSVVKDNLMFTTDKIGDTMKVAMRPADAEKWFGVAPPDLSVIARARGADWLYSFLNGFYLDDTRPTGVNNLYFPDTAMPHVLSELQGYQQLKDHGEEAGHASHAAPLELAQAGKMDEAEYRQATRDLVAFLVYVGEPAKLVRYRVGFWVIAFLFVLFVATYLMKREYWKDVH
ncbi:MAG: cytochrome c1 [Gammaproteobacteria bacterium]|nr:cytochrome c1 [Gammaproteobacteria bacterium]